MQPPIHSFIHLGIESINMRLCDAVMALPRTTATNVNKSNISTPVNAIQLLTHEPCFELILFLKTVVYIFIYLFTAARFDMKV